MRDEMFIRGDVPMTKSEVRAIVLSKLELDSDSVFYDVGAGTGSVSMEAALLMKGGWVYAIEKRAAALSLIEANRERFHLRTVETVHGEAPSVFAGLKKPTHAFIGGTSGNAREVLHALLASNPSIRIVMTAVTLETLSVVCDWIDENGIDAEILLVQIAKSRTAGNYHMMMGQNPIYVIAFGGETVSEKTVSQRAGL